MVLLRGLLECLFSFHHRRRRRVVVIIVVAATSHTSYVDIRTKPWIE